MSTGEQPQSEIEPLDGNDVDFDKVPPQTWDDTTQTIQRLLARKVISKTEAYRIRDSAYDTFPQWGNK